jgi:hypothetical protein
LWLAGSTPNPYHLLGRNGASMKLWHWLGFAILAVLAFLLGVIAHSFIPPKALGTVLVTTLGFMVIFLPFDLLAYACLLTEKSECSPRSSEFNSPAPPSPRPPP